MLWFTGLTSSNDSRLALILGVMLSAMLLPSFQIYPGLPNIRLDEVLLFGVFGLNLLVFISRRFKLRQLNLEHWQNAKPAIHSILQVFLFLTVSVIISNIYGAFFLEGSFTFRDAMEFVTLFKYYLVITLAASLNLQEAEMQVLKWVFLIGFAILLALSWGQHFNLFDMNRWLSPFFNPNHWEHLIVGNPVRVLGTFDNPNVLGNFSVLILAVLTARYYFDRNGQAISIPLLILIALTLKLILLTISRTALLSTALIFTILSVWAVFRHHWQRKTLIKLGILLIITLVLVGTASDDFFYRVNEGLNFETSTSAQGHIMRWQEAGETIAGSPILGWGTQKSTMTTLVDNEYALYLRRYGIVGLLAYLLFFLKPLILAWKRVKQQELRVYGDFGDPLTLLSIAYFAALFGVLIYNIFAGIFYNLQLMTLFGILMGFVYSTQKRSFYG